MGRFSNQRLDRGSRHLVNVLAMDCLGIDRRSLSKSHGESVKFLVPALAGDQVEKSARARLGMIYTFSETWAAPSVPPSPRSHKRRKPLLNPKLPICSIAYLLVMGFAIGQQNKINKVK